MNILVASAAGIGAVAAEECRQGVGGLVQAQVQVRLDGALSVGAAHMCDLVVAAVGVGILG